MVKTAVELRLRYPYEEFADHLRAMKTVREWQYTSRFGHLGSVQTSTASSARIVEYFSDSYPDQTEAIRKAEVFLSINDYLARHATIFSRKNLMEELQTSAFSVDPALLRAVHYLFTAADRPETIMPRKAITLAKAFQEIVEA